MKDYNIITDAAGDQYGFYNDLLEMLKEEFITEIKNNNFSVIQPDWVDLLDDLQKYENYGGILKLSDNNGMGWTVEKYQHKED